MDIRHGLSAVLLGLVLTATPVLAHHAYQAEFDSSKIKTITGVLSKVEWINPHVRWHLDIKKDDGTIEKWVVVGAGPAAMRRAGISRAGVFEVGQTYTARITLARDGSNVGHTLDFKMPDGKMLTLYFGTNE